MVNTVEVPSRAANGDTLAGFGLALAAYSLWGVQPIYMKAVTHLPILEIVLHRAIWALPVAGAVLLCFGRTADLMAALRSPRTVAMAALTTGLLSVNWGIFLWAVSTDRVIEAAFGSYINPLVNVVLAALFLGERLNRTQVVAVALAAAAVAFLTAATGVLPWISLSLAVTFSFYGFLRKTLPIGPAQGFFLEILIVFVPALAVLGWMAIAGTGHFHPGAPVDMLLMIGLGPVTAVPLLLFSFGAKKLRFTTIGLMQYLSPTIVFLVAVFLFGEPFEVNRAVAFALIWIALAIYTWSVIRTRRRAAVLPA